MSLHPCGSCRRHLASTATACPFCGARVVVAPRVAPSYARRLARAAVFAGAAACGGPSYTPPPRPPPVEYPFALPPAPAEGLANLSGVVREDGYRMAGVRVQARDEDGTVKETRTNDKGEFQFLDLAPGTYEVVPEPGYVNHRPQDGPVYQQPHSVPLGPNANVRADLLVLRPEPGEVDRGPCCKPYGAPPARRRIV